MSIDEHVETFAGLPVKEFDPAAGLTSPFSAAYRVGVNYDDEVSFGDRLEAFTRTPRAGEVTALVVGQFDAEGDNEGSGEAVEALIGAASKLPSLRHLFLGDITYEECQISWISHGDLRPLLDAYPLLETFRIRGSTGLTFSAPFRHANLRHFVIETGGLSMATLRDLYDAELPRLEHLEVWLGSDNYGWDGDPSDLQPLLGGERFTGVTHLGICNSQIADEIAPAVAASAAARRVRTLDFSRGNLSDVGGRALLALADCKQLRRLDLTHHYLSDEVQEELKKALPFEVDLSEPQEPDDDWRSIYVSE